MQGGAGPGRPQGRKAVVFLACCDGVELHYELLAKVWGAVTGAPLLAAAGGGGSGGGRSGSSGGSGGGGGAGGRSGSGSGGAGGAGCGSSDAGPSVFKLHGDMAQAQRTAAFLQFTQVRAHLCRPRAECVCVRARARGRVRALAQLSRR